jgi:hypothetical protein
VPSPLLLRHLLLLSIFSRRRTTTANNWPKQVGVFVAQIKIVSLF